MPERQTIAVLHGDGVGPEVTGAAVDAVRAAAGVHGLDVELSPAPVGWEAYKATGSTLPDETLELLRSAPGWIVGPTSAGEYPADDPINGHPSGYLRSNFKLFANIRPVHARPQIPALVPQLKTTIFRENTEGLYPDRNMFWGYGEFMPTGDVALAMRVITREACDRFARMTFEFAAAEGEPRLVVVHKRTALPRTDGLFCAAFEQLEAEYSGVSVEYMRIDTFSSMLPSEPERFSLVATTNLFGDIMSDQAAGLVGGVGLAPSLNAGADHAMAQAVHGTAADIAGQGIVNPVALILSSAMLLEWLGRRERIAGRDADAGTWQAAGQAIRAAVEQALARTTTRDLGGTASTSEFASTVVAAIEAAR
jgi:3-isopropylmalate dehydrogenase